MANNDITYVRPEVRAAMPVWKKIRDVCKGADAVKAAGNEYLPFLDPSDKSARNKKRNADYIQRAVFYAITGNTKVGLLGLAFRKDPTMTAPDKLNYLRDNADGAGASIYQQSQQVTENILEAAREGLYTDYAAGTDEAIILRYQAENIINWRTKRINGRDQLVLVVLRECMEKEDGFAYKDEIQYRELALEDGKFICRVWRKSADAGSFSVDSEYHPKPKGEDFWDEIPFTFVGAQNNDPSIDESPLAALVEINLGHYRNSADYEDSVFFCGQVQPVISGLDTAWRDWLQDKGIRVGSRSPFLLPKEGSFTYAQADHRRFRWRPRLGHHRNRRPGRHAIQRRANRIHIGARHLRFQCLGGLYAGARLVRQISRHKRRGISLQHQSGVYRQSRRIRHGNGNRQCLAVRCDSRH